MSAARPLFLRSRACNRYLLSGLSSEEEPGLLLLLPQLKTWSRGSRGRNKVTQTEKKRVYRKACPSPPPRAPFQLLVSVSWNSLLPKKKEHPPSRQTDDRESTEEVGLDGALPLQGNALTSPGGGANREFGKEDFGLVNVDNVDNPMSPSLTSQVFAIR